MNERSERMKQQWQDPAFRAAQMEGRANSVAYLNRGDKIREKALARWADPEFQQKMADVNRNRPTCRHIQVEVDGVLYPNISFAARQTGKTRHELKKIAAQSHFSRTPTAEERAELENWNPELDEFGNIKE